jgi:hypothetical protein
MEQLFYTIARRFMTTADARIHDHIISYHIIPRSSSYNHDHDYTITIITTGSAMAIVTDTMVVGKA